MTPTQRVRLLSGDQTWPVLTHVRSITIHRTGDLHHSRRSDVEASGDSPSGFGASSLGVGSDADLVQLAQAGDLAALEELLRRHKRRVQMICRRITGDQDAGHDAAQEALLAVVRGIARFDGRSTFSTWVYRVATNAALYELRLRSRRPVLFADGVVPEAVSGADEGCDQAIGRIDANRALQLLPDYQRVAVVLRDLLDLDYATIAGVLVIRIGTAKSRVARGRAALAKIIAEQNAAAGNSASLEKRPITR